MRREWKPGDVGVYQFSPAYARLIALRVKRGDCLIEHHGLGDHWHLSNGGWTHSASPNVRPLVTVDPEDREQVLRLCDAFSAASDPGRSRADQMQAALREFAEPKPPKPEPFKPGDVVRHRVSGNVFTVAADGQMVSHKDGHVYDNGPDWFADNVTPEYYERLTVTEDGTR